jgi:hypothetical protein
VLTGALGVPVLVGAVLGQGVAVGVPPLGDGLPVGMVGWLGALVGLAGRDGAMGVPVGVGVAVGCPGMGMGVGRPDDGAALPPVVGVPVAQVLGVCW